MFCPFSSCLRLPDKCGTDTLHNGNTLGHPQRALSLHFLAGELLEETRQSGLPEQTTVRDLEPVVICPKGAGKLCPRDGRQGAAYVDCVDGPSNAGIATHMLSYTWGYRIVDITAALAYFAAQKDLDSHCFYIWICCFCINQHRVREAQSAGLTIPFHDFEQTFRERVTGIGSIIALMAPWIEPQYLKRVWCVFEFATAMSHAEVETHIVMPPAESQNFMDSLCDEEGLSKVWAAFGKVSVENAEASNAEDRNHILSIIEQDSGFRNFNNGIKQHLQQWVINTILDVLPRAYQEADWRPFNAGGELLMKIGRCEKAIEVLEKGRAVLDSAKLLDTLEGAKLLNWLAKAKLRSHDFGGAEAAFKHAIRNRTSAGVLETPDGAELLRNVAACRFFKTLAVHEHSDQDMSELSGILDEFEHVKTLLERIGSLDTSQEAGTLLFLGRVKIKLGDWANALSDLTAALEIRERKGLVDPIAMGQLLKDIGIATAGLHGSCDDALDFYGRAKDSYELSGTLVSPDGAEVLLAIGKLKLERGELQDALQNLLAAEKTMCQYGTQYEITDVQNAINEVRKRADLEQI